MEQAKTQTEFRAWFLDYMDKLRNSDTRTTVYEDMLSAWIAGRAAEKESKSDAPTA